MAKRCPRYVVKRSEDPDTGAPEFTVRAHGDLAGTLTTRFWDGKYYVSSISVLAGHKRCGVGTKLYEAAAKYGCNELQTPLWSDEARSGAAQAFWGKQVAKGRAFCVKKDQSTGREAPSKFEDIFIARDGCAHYELKCPVTDLSGGKRKRKRRLPS